MGVECSAACKCTGCENGKCGDHAGASGQEARGPHTVFMGPTHEKHSSFIFGAWILGASAVGKDARGLSPIPGDPDAPGADRPDIARPGVPD